MAVMLLVHDGKLRYDQPLPRSSRGFRHTPAPSPSATCSPTPRACPTTKTRWTRTSGRPNIRFRMRKCSRCCNASNSEVRRGDELGIQQFRLRAARPDRRQGIRQALRQFPRRAHLQAAAHERTPGLPQRQEHCAESRIRAFGEGRRIRGDRPEFDFRHAGRWRRLFESRRPGQMGCCPAKSHTARRRRNERRAHAGQTRERRSSRTGPRHRATTI